MQDLANKTPIQAVVITVSDSRNENNDISGVTLVGLLLGIGAQVVDKIIVTDELDKLVETLKKTSEIEGVNLILTTGGTAEHPRYAHATHTLRTRPLRGSLALPFLPLISFQKWRNTIHEMSRSVRGCGGYVSWRGSPRRSWPRAPAWLLRLWALWSEARESTLTRTP